ncbi:MAG: hypothetical protein DRP74_05600 [Candidatus Omnitrophota bacterium]|nr:MAG: hypothetical protein DRP74_05600 [Candidatus Omnitrophota bacterium]
MSKEILINVEPQEKRVAVVSDGILEEFYIERPQDKTIVGNIYKGVIEAVVPSVGAAFVDIGLPKKGFLYLSEIESVYEPLENQGKKPASEFKKGQEVLVQVVKESFGTKGPRLSCHIGIAGRYLVLMPQNGANIGVSRRIDDDAERRRLKRILGEIKLSPGIGFIIRTAAMGRSKNELIRDVNFLIKLWRRLEKQIRKNKAPALIYEEYDLILRVIRDSFTDDVAKLAIDSAKEYFRIRRFIKSFLKHLLRKMEFYRGDDLFEDKDVERQINRIFENKVYLKSKAYIVIEATEGLVVIDVNSGGYTRKLGQEEAAFRVNCEAAAEIARQLILRDLGGIIVIDFIDMDKEEHRREVLNILKKSLRKDTAKYDILGISRFGLIEMTREHVHNTVQALSFHTCPYCQGKGRVKSPLTMSIYTLREIKKFLKRNKFPRQISVTLNPQVIDEVLNDKQSIRFIEKRFRTRINLISNPSLHVEEIEIT